MRVPGPTIGIIFVFEKITWPDLVDRACRIVESEFPESPIDGAILFRGAEAKHELVEDRLAFLRARVKTKLRRLTLTNHFSCVRAKKTGVPYLGQIGLGGTMFGGTDNRYSFGVTLPSEQFWDAYERILVATCDLFGALPTGLSSLDTMGYLGRVQWGRDWGQYSKEEIALGEKLLPRFKPPHPVFPVIPTIDPGCFHWLNYWPAESAAHANFPGSSKLLLEWSYRTPAGGWLVKIGKEPLDWRNRAHLELLSEAYQTYPQVGSTYRN